MKQNRQSKIVAIVALCISVLGLTLGFAAFSNTLTISSSATVSPDEADFKITVLGLNQSASTQNIEDVIFDVSNYNETSSYPVANTSVIKATPAVIDNKELTLNNISATLTTDDQNVAYYFVLRNDGEYDAYFDVGSLADVYQGKTGVCTPAAGTSANLVDQTCSSIELAMMLATEEGEIDVTTIDKYKIEKGGHIILIVGLRYDDATVYADGDFSVSFEDLKLEFSTTK